MNKSSQSKYRPTFQAPRVLKNPFDKENDARNLSQILNQSQQMPQVLEKKSSNFFSVPEAPSYFDGDISNNKNITLSQILPSSKPKPVRKFSAPMLKKQTDDDHELLQSTQRDLTLSQLLGSPPRKTLGSLQSSSVQKKLKNPFLESQDDAFRTPQSLQITRKKVFKPPLDGKHEEKYPENSFFPSRKLIFSPSEKKKSSDPYYFDDENKELFSQSTTKCKANHNIHRAFESQDVNKNSSLTNLFQNNDTNNIVPEAPTANNLFSDESNFSDLSVSQAIKTHPKYPDGRKNENFRNDVERRNEDFNLHSQISLFEENSQRPDYRRKSGESKDVSICKTPAGYKYKNSSDDFNTPASLNLPGNLHKLRSIEEIPSRYRDIFEFPYFNVIQSMVFDEVFYTDKSMVVSAPTGSGKTVVFEIAIVRLLTNTDYSRTKIVYMAPVKALCSERFNDWKEKFGPLGVICKELTGDTVSDEFQDLQEANLVLTTPEKWDSMSRKWKDNKSLFNNIALFLVDEIHILNDETRGATVEAVLSRMKTLILTDLTKQPNKTPIRFIVVSATIPNSEDLADWLGSSERPAKPALNFRLDEKYRPVKLNKIVLGYVHKEGESEFKFDINLTYKLKNIIDTYSNGRPTLVFCSSRKMVTQTADVLIKQNHGRSFAQRENKDLLKQESLKLRESKIADQLSHGIGVHHAGMDSQDRHSIEDLFRQGILPILVATSTLAMGVNLPAHLVILKSTTFYSMGCPTEYPDTQILQMIGRAGRPQFDTTATAVIMTKTSSKAKYESIVNGTQTIESSLHKNLIEHLNAEVVLHTITDIALAVEWIRHTFLYVRIMKNPRHYGVPPCVDKKQVEKRLEDLCLKSVNSLAEMSLVKMNDETLEIESTETGKLMARYCIAFETMKKFHHITGKEHIDELLTLITDCAEFQDITLRQTEKTTLNTLNKDKIKESIRYPLVGKIKTKQMKINCLIQASFSCLPIHDYSLTNDITKIFRVGVRVVKCLLEFLWQRKDYKVLLSAIQLSKCFKQRLWEDSKYVTKQLDKIGTTISLALANAGLISFHKLGETNPREIELIANRHPPFGNQVKEAVSSLPKYELAIEQVKKYKERTAELVITINLINKDLLQSKPNTNHQAYFLIGDTDNNIVFKWRILDSVLLKDDGWRRKIDVKRSEMGPDLFVHLLSQEWVGIDIHTVYVPIYTCNNSISLDNHQQVKNEVPEVPHHRSAEAECAHKCSNKLTCAHKCCKEGINNSKQTPKTPKIPKQPVKLRGLQAQMNILKHRTQDLPHSAKDIKRPRLGTSSSGQPTPTIDLSMYAYQKNKMATPQQQKPDCSYVNETPIERTTSLHNKQAPVSHNIAQDISDYGKKTLKRQEVLDYDGRRQVVNDGWEKLNQHQQEQESIYNQGNFNIELSPVIENDTSSGELLQTIVPYSSDEFESPRPNLSSTGNQVNQENRISYVPNNNNRVYNAVRSQSLDLNHLNRSDIISIEPVGYYSHGNTDCMNNRDENGTYGNNTILNNRESAARTDVKLATDNQCIDVTYWNPGFSSDEDMEMFEDQIQTKNAVIIGKPPSVTETSNKSTNKINQPGARGRNSYSTNNQNRTDMDNRLSNRPKISDVTDSSGAVNKSTNKNYSQIQKEMLMEVDNLFCGLDSDTDEEKEKGFNDAIIEEDICLPSLNYTRRSNPSRQNHIQNIGHKNQNWENPVQNLNHTNSYQNRQNSKLNEDKQHQNHQISALNPEKRYQNLQNYSLNPVKHYQNCQNHYSERYKGENSVNNKSQNVVQTDKSTNVLENQISGMYLAERQQITDRQQTSNIFQVDFDDDFDQLDTELSPPRNQKNPERGHTNTKDMFDLYKEESKKRQNTTVSPVSDQIDTYQNDNLTGQKNPARYQMDRLDLTNTAMAISDKQTNKGQLLKVPQKSNIPDDFHDDWDCSQIIPQMSSSSRLQESYPGQDSKRCNYGNTSNISRINHYRSMEQPFPQNQNKIIENTGMRNHTEVRSEYTTNSAIPEKISVSRRKDALSDVMNGPNQSLSSNLYVQSDKNISRNSPIKRTNGKPETDLQYKEVAHPTTLQQENHTSKDFIVSSKVHSKPKFNLKSVDYIYSDDDTSNSLKLSQHDRVLCQPVKHDQSIERFQKKIPFLDTLADCTRGSGDVQINERLGSKWNNSERQSYRGDFNESFRSGSRSVGNHYGDRSIGSLQFKGSPEMSFRADEASGTYGSTGDIIMAWNDIAEQNDQFHPASYKVSSLDRPRANTSSEKSIYEDQNIETPYALSSDIDQAMEAQYRLSSSDDYQTKVLVTSPGYQAKVQEKSVHRQPQYRLTSPSYQGEVSEISVNREMPCRLISANDYKSPCYKDQDVKTSPINCNKEHRYGQVLAWVPDDGGSPRPTTLPLKSPVPPAYLSQSPPLINSERIMFASDPVKPEIEKSVGLSSFFCPIVKVDDNNHDNFNNLFQGIF